MYGIYSGDMSYWLLVIVSLVLGIGAQSFIKLTYAKWSRVPVPGKTGAQVAQEMLEDQNVASVGIKPIAGELTDNYNPMDNCLHLSHANLEGGSVASIAVACHEAGHAVQAARGFLPYKLRSALVPVVTFASNTWMLVFMAGMFFRSTSLITWGIAFFAAVVVFQLVTLPVEIDASRRAVAYVSRAVGPHATAGAKAVLFAAAMTYVAAALTSILQLIYFLNASDRD